MNAFIASAIGLFLFLSMAAALVLLAANAVSGGDDE